MISLQDIGPLSEFQRNTKAHVRRLKRTGRPAVLTINGRAELVVQDAVAYQQLLNELDQAEAVAGIRRGLASAKKGEGIPAGEFARRMRRKHRLPKVP